MGDNTTNRCEGTFAHFKVQIEKTIGKKPKLAKLIPTLVKLAESQPKANANRNKRVKVVSEEYSDCLYRASFDLGETGMRHLFKSLKALSSVEFLGLQIGEVKVKSNRGPKQYKTFEDKCNCKRYKNLKVPCHHILALREKLSMPLYEKLCFDKRYFWQKKNANESLADTTVTTEASLDGTVADEGTFDFEVENFHSPSARMKASDSQTKYSKALKLASSLSNDMAEHGQRSFDLYMNQLQKFKALVRLGKLVQISEKVTTAHPEVSFDGVANLFEENPVNETESQFVFHRRVVSRGRPRGNRGQSFRGMSSAKHSTSRKHVTKEGVNTLPRPPVTQQSAVGLWISKLALTMESKREIEGNDWLGDEVMNAILSLVPGNESDSVAVLAANLGSQSTMAGFQFMNINQNHWVLGSTLQGKVDIYDSMMGIKPKVVDDLATQIRSSYLTLSNNDKIVVHFQPCPQQTNSRDCGPYAIATLCEIFHGGDPSAIVFLENQLRPHLLTMLMDGKLSKFPSDIKKGRRGTVKIVEI